MKETLERGEVYYLKESAGSVYPIYRGLKDAIKRRYLRLRAANFVNLRQEREKAVVNYSFSPRSIGWQNPWRKCRS